MKLLSTLVAAAFLLSAAPALAQTTPEPSAPAGEKAEKKETKKTEKKHAKKHKAEKKTEEKKTEEAPK